MREPPRDEATRHHQPAELDPVPEGPHGPIPTKATSGCEVEWNEPIDPTIELRAEDHLEQADGDVGDAADQQSEHEIAPGLGSRRVQAAHQPWSAPEQEIPQHRGDAIVE